MRTQLLSPENFNRAALPALSFVWLTGVLTGFLLLWRYETTPGPAAQAALRWPAASAIVPSDERPTLVMFVHPHCPCSRASIAQLGSLVDRVRGRADVHVYFFLPSGADARWSQTELYHAARGIPGVRVGLDEDNAEARRFGATTSGHAALFDREGRMLFAGGLTAARGHVGDSVASRSVVSLLEGRTPEATESLTFGCPLSDSDSP